MFVLKRNGKRESVKFDKVTARIEKLTQTKSNLFSLKSLFNCTFNESDWNLKAGYGLGEKKDFTIKICHRKNYDAKIHFYDIFFTATYYLLVSKKYVAVKICRIYLLTIKNYIFL